MKIIPFNKKEPKKPVTKKQNKKNKKQSKGVHHNIPLDFLKDGTNTSFGNVLSILPQAIKTILSNGNNPVSIKHNSSITEIKTDTNLVITLKTPTISDKIPQCKILDKNTKTYLLNTYR